MQAVFENERVTIGTSCRAVAEPGCCLTGSNRITDNSRRRRDSHGHGTDELDGRVRGVRDHARFDHNCRPVLRLHLQTKNRRRLHVGRRAHVFVSDRHVADS